MLKIKIFFKVVALMSSPAHLWNLWISLISNLYQIEDIVNKVLNCEKDLDFDANHMMKMGFPLFISWRILVPKPHVFLNDSFIEGREQDPPFG